MDEAILRLSGENTILQFSKKINRLLSKRKTSIMRMMTIMVVLKSGLEI